MWHVSAVPLEWAINPNFRLSADGLSWSAVCFKIATRYTCGFFVRLLAFFPASWGCYSQVYDHFLRNAHIYAHKKAHIYAYLAPPLLSWVSWLSNSFSFNLHKMSLRYQFAISSQAPIIWKDILFITSVWRFFCSQWQISIFDYSH